MSVTARTKTKVTVLNPEGYPPKVSARAMAPGLDTLDGKKIFLVDVGFANSDTSRRSCRTTRSAIASRIRLAAEPALEEDASDAVSDLHARDTCAEADGRIADLNDSVRAGLQRQLKMSTVRYEGVCSVPPWRMVTVPADPSTRTT